MAKYEVLYCARPVCDVGQGTASHQAGEHYPGDYAGQVISVRWLGQKPSLVDMADQDRPVIVLELADIELAGLCARELKIADKRPVPVTFDDRWGAAAALLRGRFADVGEMEARAQTNLIALPDKQDLEGEEFTLVSALLVRGLPANRVSTGTGLYAVKAVPGSSADTQAGKAGQVITLTVGGLGTADVWKGGYINNTTRVEIRAIVSHTNMTATLEGGLGNWQNGDDLTVYDAWSTIQAAVTQVWTDQQAPDFTATQEVRIYDGTYNEVVAFNAGLRPTWFYRLVIKAASGNDSVIVTNAGLATHTFHANTVDSTTFQDLEIRNVLGNKYAILVQCYSTRVFECVFDGEGTGSYAIRGTQGDTLVRGCSFTGFASNGIWYCGKVERCFFDNVVLYQQVGGLFVESCVFDGADGKINFWAALQNPVSEAPIRVANCTFYGSDNPFNSGAGAGHKAANLQVRNCVFSGCGTVYDFEGGRFDANRNCYYNCTKIAAIGGTDYTTLATWQAFSDVDGDSPDADSLVADPRLTNPGADDFSLQSDSPCIAAGAGAGVLTDIDDAAFDAFHPDIGAMSSGIKDLRKRGAGAALRQLHQVAGG